MLKRFDYGDNFANFEAFFVDKIEGAFSRFDMEAIKTGTDRLKKGDVYVEVGTQYGRSTYVTACLLPDGVDMYAVDIFDVGAHENCMSRKDFFELVGLDSVCKYINKPSDVAAKEYKGGPISMMFIDADHTYEGVKLDLESWYPHVKKGGYIYFHDADESSPGVVKLMKQLKKDPRFDEFTTYKKTLGHNTSIVSVRKK